MIVIDDDDEEKNEKEKENKNKEDINKDDKEIVINHDNNDEEDENDNNHNNNNNNTKGNSKWSNNKRQDITVNSLIDDDIIIIDNRNKKKKTRIMTRSRKRIEPIEKEKDTQQIEEKIMTRKRKRMIKEILDNTKSNNKEIKIVKDKDKDKEKEREKEKEEEEIEEEEEEKHNIKKGKISSPSTISSQNYPILSKMNNLNKKFELTYIVRPNSKREHAENDDSVCIWDCAFEPTIEGNNASHIVATCGANNVSMIECHTGKVIAKYTNLIEVENYYSLDWTVIKVNSENSQSNTIMNKRRKVLNSKIKNSIEPYKNSRIRHRNNNINNTIERSHTTTSKNQYCPILAAGGQLGEIIFLNRMQGECFRYAEPKVSKPQPITQLRFSKDNPKWLFAGSEDKFVYLYDIGELNDTEQDAATNLAKFVGLKKDPTAINVNKNNLIVGCSDGVIVIYSLSNIPTVEDAIKSNHLTNISISYQFSSLHNTYIDDIIPYFPLSHHHHHQNSLVNIFFTRGAKDHISLWSMNNLDLDSSTPEKSTSKRNLKKLETILNERGNGRNSRGKDSNRRRGGGEEKESKNEGRKESNIEIVPTILSKLKWSHYVECVRFSVVNDEDETLLLTGSGAGDINIYKLQENKSLKLISTFKHEQSEEAIHQVVLSKDKKYLVGVNEINLAFIWKLK
jgi:hypothetical protein